MRKMLRGILEFIIFLPFLIALAIAAKLEQNTHYVDNPYVFYGLLAVITLLGYGVYFLLFRKLILKLINFLR